MRCYAHTAVFAPHKIEQSNSQDANNFNYYLKSYIMETHKNEKAG